MEVVVQILLVLFYVLSGIIAFYFLLPAFLFISYYVKGGLKKKFSYDPQGKQFEFAAIITAHQDVRFVPPFVDSFLKQRYPNFKVYVVADDCDVTDLNFNDERIIVLKPEVALHSKIKSIQYAIDHFVNDPDVMIIFDSDNLVHPDYLKNLCGYFQQGFRVVQTHMLSKNTDTTYSRRKFPVFQLGLATKSDVARLSQAPKLDQDTKHGVLVSNGPSRALGQATKHIL